jgi:Kef-type K+ transport system membrane component KefB
LVFVFLVGLEIDISVAKREAKLSIPVAAAGMALPFGFGVLLSKLLYHHFIPATSISCSSPELRIQSGLSPSFVGF